MKVSSFYIKTVSLKRIYKTSVKIFKEKKWLLDLKYRSLCKYLEIDHQITAGPEIRIINALLLLTQCNLWSRESSSIFVSWYRHFGLCDKSEWLPCWY